MLLLLLLLLLLPLLLHTTLPNLLGLLLLPLLVLLRLGLATRDGERAGGGGEAHPRSAAASPPEPRALSLITTLITISITPYVLDGRGLILRAG